MGPPLILVADADAEAARRLASYFSNRGFGTCYTSLGEEVLRLAGTGRLRVAIVDVSLLDMSGYLVAAQLKAMDPRICVLMTAGDYRPELEMRARQVGVVYYAQKPANYELIEAVVARAIGTSACALA